MPVREDQACIPETHSRIVQRGVVRAHAGKTQSFETVIEIVQRLPGKTRPEIGSVDRPYSAFRYGEINGQRSRRQFHFQIDFRAEASAGSDCIPCGARHTPFPGFSGVEDRAQIEV